MTTEHNIVSFVLLFDYDFSLFERACFSFFFFFLISLSFALSSSGGTAICLFRYHLIPHYMS